MPNRLREALARLWTSLWSRHEPDPDKTEPAGPRDGRAEARARFWAEFRAGQREAEAHSSRPR